VIIIHQFLVFVVVFHHLLLLLLLLSEIGGDWVSVRAIASERLGYFLLPLPSSGRTSALSATDASRLSPTLAVVPAFAPRSVGHVSPGFGDSRLEPAEPTAPVPGVVRALS